MMTEKETNQPAQRSVHNKDTNKIHELCASNVLKTGTNRDIIADIN